MSPPPVCVPTQTVRPQRAAFAWCVEGHTEHTDGFEPRGEGRVLPAGGEGAATGGAQGLGCCCLCPPVRLHPPPCHLALGTSPSAGCGWQSRGLLAGIRCVVPEPSRPALPLPGSTKETPAGACPARRCLPAPCRQAPYCLQGEVRMSLPPSSSPGDAVATLQGQACCWVTLACCPWWGCSSCGKNRHLPRLAAQS